MFDNRILKQEGNGGQMSRSHVLSEGLILEVIEELDYLITAELHSDLCVPGSTDKARDLLAELKETIKNNKGEYTNG